MMRPAVLVLLAARRVRREPRAVAAILLLGLVACLTAATVTSGLASVQTSLRAEAMQRAGVAGRSVRVLATPRHGGFAAVDSRVRSAATGLQGGTVVGALLSSPYALTGGDPRARVTVGFSPDMVAAARLTGGRWPRSAHEVAVPEAAAQRFGWRPGGGIRLGTLVPTQADAGPLTVTGTYQVPDPRAPAWSDDARHGHGVEPGDYVAVGPLLAASPEVPALRDSADALWRLIPDPARETGPGPVEDLMTVLRRDPDLVVDSSLPGTLQAISDQARRTRTASLGPVLVLLLLAVCAAGLCGLVLAALHRRGDDLLRSRGASWVHLLTVTVLVLLLLVPGAVVAALAAPRLAARVLGLPSAGTDSVGVAGVASLVTVLVVALAALVASQRDPEQSAGTGLVTDLAVVALAALAWTRGRAVTSVDAMAVVSPLLGLGAVALLAWRLGQLAVRVLAPLAGRATGLAAPWAVWRLRAPSLTARTTQLLVTLLAATCTLALVQLESDDARLRDDARVIAPSSVVVSLTDAASVVPGRLGEVGAQLHGPWAAVVRRPTVQDAQGAFDVIAVDAGSDVLPQDTARRTVAGPEWATAVRSLDLPVWPRTGAPAPAHPDDVIEVTLEDTDDKSRSYARTEPWSALEVHVDDGAGRRFVGQIPATGRPGVTHRVRVGTLLPAGTAGLVAPLHISWVSLSGDTHRTPILTRMAERSPGGTPRSLLPHPQQLSLPETGDHLSAVVGPGTQQSLPVLVSRSLAATRALAVGDTLMVDIGDGSGALGTRVVAIADRVPGASTEDGPAAMVDLRSLQQRAGHDSRLPLAAQTIWSAVPASSLDGARWPADAVLGATTYDRELATLRAHVVPRALRGVHRLLLAATVLMALLAVCAAAGATARAEVRAAAVLHALGSPRAAGRIADRVVAWGRAGTGVLVGIVAGLALAPGTVHVWTGVDERVQPHVPWWWLAGLAAALLLALGGGGAVAARTGAPRPAVVLRTGDDR